MDFGCEEVNEIKGGMEMGTITGNEIIAKVESRPIGRMAAYWSATIILVFSIALCGVGVQRK